jgi:hypothetical protein
MFFVIRPSFEVVREGRISQLRIKTVFEDIIFWQAQNDYHFWTIITILFLIQRRISGRLVKRGLFIEY